MIASLTKITALQAILNLQRKIALKAMLEGNFKRIKFL